MSIRAIVDSIFSRHHRLRDACFKLFPFAVKGIYHEEWDAYLQQSVELPNGMDALSEKLARRLISRRRRYRYLLTPGEIFRCARISFLRMRYRFPPEGTLVKSVFYYRAGTSFLKNTPCLKGRCVLDGGAASGDSSLALSELGPSKVYAFEPSPAQRSEIELVLKMNSVAGGVEVVPYALSDSPKAVSFFDQYANRCEASAITIDEFASDKDVGLIKLDIEGEEFPALKGAAKTLSRCHPVLIVCVYHRPQDLFEMPSWLVRNFPEYKFILRDTEPGNRGACVHLTMIAWVD